ncbi:MAG: uL15 family ribosomal protein, partial [Negativicutes bacterium]|nr:uL15 family ribosomal protein [Negativicutes bacterium]
RGFNNQRFARQLVEVNLAALDRCFADGAEIDPVALVEAGVIKNVRDGIKVLGNGELSKRLTVRAHGFSGSALEKFEAASGRAEVI